MRLLRDRKPILHWVLSQPRSGCRRVVAEEPCEVVLGHRHRPGVVWNLSRLGAFVVFDPPLPPVGDELSLSFLLDGELVACTARVAWLNPPSVILAGLGSAALGLPPGCGVTFVAISDDAQQRIEARVRAEAEADRARTPSSNN